MALSFSRPDPSSPDAVAAASFSTGRRGYDQTEVRDLLRMVAAEMARLQEREKFLERELRTAQRGQGNSAIALDEEVVTRMLGEEAARILQTAREAASQIKLRSEDAASRMLREATDEAQRMREEAEVEAARRRQDASADAESELVMAKQQGREMVNEARAYRERVLSELARRRELARQQIEQLMHGRDRLLQAFERSRLVAVDVMAELTPLGEPSEYVNLAPTTGPVPLMVPNQRAPEEPVQDLPVAVTVVDVDEEVADTPDEVDEIVSIEVLVLEPVEDVDNTVLLMRETHEVHDHDELDDARKAAPVVALFGGDDDDETGSVEGPTATVDDLFARLRAARAESVIESAQQDEAADDASAADASSADSTEPDDADATRMLTIVEDLAVFQASPEAPTVEEALDDSSFGQREASLTPLIVASARKLKRVLADEQNEILHALRRKEPVSTIDTMLPWQTEQATRYAAAITTELEKAALLGAASIDSGTTKEHKADINRNGATKAAIEALTSKIVVPLRERLERAVSDADGDNEELANMVRGIYREWKTQRIDEHLDDVARAAFGRGALAAVVPGTKICWMVDPNGPACPDAEDNALAGEVAAGQPFPTGDTCAPAHEGCRCMLALAPR